jgi:cytochrome b subunit of formate dehydrogenase
MNIPTALRRRIRAIGRICGWLTMILALVTLLTGYGITQFRIVDSLTYGILNKALAQRLHGYTDLPFLALMLTHVGIALWWRMSSSNPKGG